MNNSNDTPVPASVLSAQLRSGHKHQKQLALDYIARRTRGLHTERQRYQALGVSAMAWLDWRRQGLVPSIPDDERVRAKTPTKPIKLSPGKYAKVWIRVDWVRGNHPTNGRTLRKAEIRTSTGDSWTMPAWEGKKFVAAMLKIGWVER